MGLVPGEIAHFELAPWPAYGVAPQGYLAGQEDRQFEVAMGLGLVQPAGWLLRCQCAAQGPHAMGDGATKAEEPGTDDRRVNGIEIPRDLGKASPQVGGQYPALGA